jgi:hypothetical protein
MLASNYSDIGHIVFKEGELNAKAIELFRELVDFGLIQFRCRSRREKEIHMARARNVTPACIVPGCRRSGVNDLGVRLRRRDRSAWWARETAAVRL